MESQSLSALVTLLILITAVAFTLAWKKQSEKSEPAIELFRKGCFFMAWGGVVHAFAFTFHGGVLTLAEALAGVMIASSFVLFITAYRKK